jgi:hypothetical protein
VGYTDAQWHEYEHGSGLFEPDDGNDATEEQ